MLNAGIGSSMDSIDEDIQAFNINEEDIANDEQDLDDDVEEIIIGNAQPFAPPLDLNVDNQVLPEESNEYIHTLEYRTRQLEQELEECDDLLKYNVHDNNSRPSQSLVPYDDMKELEELAADKGLTVEELKQQLLNELDEDDFGDEEVDTGYEEIHQLQRELADARNEVGHLVEDVDQELLEFLKNREIKDHQKPLAIEDGEKSSETEDKEHESAKDTMRAIDDFNVQMDSNGTEAGPLVLPSALTDMRQFIHQQLKLTDETLGEREKKFKESLESQRHAEEKQMMKNEQQRKAFLQQFREEEAMLMERKKQEESKMDEEMKNKEGELEEEYRNHQAHIESLIEDFESEKHLYETTCKEIQERTADRKRNAAVEIQRRYKGFRTRKQMRVLIQELDEKREARQKEKYELRVMEVQYEINFKAEQAEKEKEEQKKKEDEEKKRQEKEEKQKELEKRKQEEAETIAQEIRKEEERKKKEELEAEKRRQKEIEEERKLEEKKKKEEEKLRKEEEKKRKEEEKRLKKEQEKKRKEEEKQKQEEEKRHKEAEKKQRILEEQKQKEEEKRTEQEKRPRETESKKETQIHGNIQTAQEVQNVLSHDDSDKSLTSKSHIITNKLKENEEEEDKNKATIEEESVTKDELKGQGSHRKNLHSPESEKSQMEVEVKLTDQSYPITSTLESQTMAERKNLETSLVQESTFNQEANNQSSEVYPAVQKTAFDSKVSSSNAVNKVESPEIAATVASTKDVVVSSQIPMVPVVNEIYKPDPTEQLRLEWIKHCLPWSKVSNEPWKLKQQSTGKILKRPSSAKKFPPVSEAVVLAAAQAESLRQVSSVKLSDLPGCSLSTLSQCWSLRYLTITNSSLVCLDGLSACKHLMYLNAENNKIEYVDLKDLGALQCVQLSNNQLTGTSGFDGCINLRWLDLSRNKIRRISGLGTTRRLHTLNLSNNQLTSVEGIDQAVTLQELDLSYNFLQAFEKAEKLCLLTKLNLASNNLLQPPVLKNQVLLQWLDLTENSLQSLTKLSRNWLPLLNDLRCGNNRVEFLDGLEKVISLMNLDVSDNQISDLESLKSGLAHCQNLQNFNVQGNPVVDVYATEYREIVLQTVPYLHFIDNVPVVSKKNQTSKSMSENNLLQLCQTQIRLHQKLRDQFESQMKSFLAIKTSTAEELCSTIFSYCDTSFKMASEHRSAHEFGDIGVAKSISHFESPAKTFPKSMNGLSDSSSVNNHITRSANINETQNMRDKFDSCLAPSKFSQESMRAKGLANVNDKNVSENVEATFFNKAPQSDHSSHQDDIISNGLTTSQVTGKNKFKSYNSVDSQKIVAVDSDSDDDEGKFVDVTKDVESKDTEKFMYSKIPHPPADPPIADSYLNEKDKFLMAFEGGSGDTTTSYRPSPRSINSNGSYLNTHLKMSSEIMNPAAVKDKPTFTEPALDSMTAKEKFNALFSGEATKTKPSNEPSQMGIMNGKHGENEKHNTPFSKLGDPKIMQSVKADVVGSHLAALDRENQGNEFGLDTSLDSDFDLDNLDFDLEKYLDMGELDEFLEKGWRPADSPQIPQSNYPVLGRIQDANGSNNSRENGQRKATTVPPSNPQPAWRDSPMSDMRHPPQPPHMPPLPNPSPSPSSVASAAETLGGGSIKSKRDEIAEEWGFKDSRTAQMMMARAKKMKYNAERKRKLNKLDPHQRYQLFRKLEESGKIQHVRPPPAKVLPRKEYFQAREEEAQRQEVERHVEERSRVHRTFEWVHTQVGDHPISTSRINPVPAPVYSNNDGTYARSSDLPYNINRKTRSPGSDYLDSASVIKDNFHRQARRFSVDEAFDSQSPVLPPIKINSAPSHHKDERMSWRDNPTQKSSGWGGGKKRSGR